MKGEGLELIAIGHTEWFPVDYDFSEKQYRDDKGKIRKEVVDVSCMSCGRGYYTLEFNQVMFCPFCGAIERRRFLMLHELKEYLKDQDWSYLNHISWQPFGVTTGEFWQLKFAGSIQELQRMRGYVEVKPIIER